MASVLEACAGTASERAIAAGETLLADGARAGVLFILIEGEVEILKGEFQIGIVSEPGSVFGEISALLGTPHTATVKTTVPSRFYVVDDPLEFFGSCSEVALGIARLLAERLDSMTSYLVDLKRQYEGSGDHLGMVDEVLETLSHAQRSGHRPGSNRDPDPTVS